jgi:hypothetical protein
MEEGPNDTEAQEEALSEAESPGQVLDPLAEPAGTRGTQRTVIGGEYDEEDARTRPPEDGLDSEVPEDEQLHLSRPLNVEEELEDLSPDSIDSDEKL